MRSPSRKTRQEISRLKEAVDELVIAWIAMGLTLEEVAWNLKRSRKTIEFRWGQIKQIHGFRSYQDATRYAMVKKLIPFKP